MRNPWLTSSLLLLALQFPLSYTNASERQLPPNTITVPGTASKKVPADRLRLRFALQIASSTLADAKNRAEGIAEKLRRIPLPSDTIAMQVEIDLSNLRQKAVSWRKGKKIVYDFNTVITGFALEELHDIVVAIADRSLQLDDDLTIKEITTKLSKANQEVVLHQLLGLAVQSARERAEVIANATDLNILRVESVVGASPEVPLHTLYAAGVVDYRTPFTVRPDLDSTLEVSATVVVQFAVETNR